VGTVQLGFHHEFAPSIVQDYFRKRAEWYERRIAAPPEASRRDDYDDRSHIVLASDGRQCLGGLRATVRQPGDPRLLPTERLCAGLSVFELFPEAGLRDRPHAELSKLVILSDDGPPSYTNDLAFRLLHFLLKERNPEPGVEYALISASRLHSRMYRGLGRMMGLRPVVRELPLELIPECHHAAIAMGNGAVLLLFPLHGEGR
jgi:hypothetical protein